jgi:enoyl-CoA hydratase/carnithine racemase
VNRVVPAAELDAEVDRMVENLARKLPQTTATRSSTSTSGATSRGTRRSITPRDWLALSMATEEPKAAIQRFLERRSGN